MKRALLMLLLVPAFVVAQNVTTENTRNKFKNFTGTASTDSVSTTASKVKYLVSVSVNTSVASDSIFIKQVTSTGATGAPIAKIILGSTIVGSPTWIPLNCLVDSAYVTVQRLKTSDVTLIWRDRP